MLTLVVPPTMTASEPGGAVPLGEYAERAYLEYALSVVKAGFYTHLRAHETVLELVCRSLLEKKNYAYRLLLSYHASPTFLAAFG